MANANTRVDKESIMKGKARLPVAKFTNNPIRGIMARLTATLRITFCTTSSSLLGNKRFMAQYPGMKKQ